MKARKVFILIVATLYLFLFSFSNPVAAKVFELEENTQSNENNLQKFLADATNGVKGVPIGQEDCLPGSPFKSMKITINPPTIEKGQSIKMKQVGTMSIDTHVQRVYVVASLNGKQVFTDQVVKNVDVPKGLYSYEYEVSVPGFIPAGHFEAKIYLHDSKLANLSCFRIFFDV